jgi:MFS superfamily sulfate permease-like transporter
VTNHANRKQVGMGALVLALVLGIMLRTWLSPLLRVPYTVLVLIVGLAIGFIAYLEERTTGSDIFSLSVGVWIRISPEAILNGASAGRRVGSVGWRGR